MADKKPATPDTKAAAGCLIVLLFAGLWLYGRCTKSNEEGDQRMRDKFAAESKEHWAQAAAASPATDTATLAAPARAVSAPEPVQPKWYQGGTLHQAGALEWQQATPQNKLATAADLLAKLWMDGKLKPKVAQRIHDVDDLMGPAAELVEGLNRALEKNGDAKLNRKIYTNQKVSEIAAMLLVMMGWV